MAPLLIIFLFILLHIVSGFAPTKTALHFKRKEQIIMKTNLMAINNPAMASALASKLYPASMIGTLGEIYFLTRNEMECPRGAVSLYFCIAGYK